MFEVGSRIIMQVEEIATPKQEPCKLHDWWDCTDETGKPLGLICIKCRQTPRMEE